MSHKHNGWAVLALALIALLALTACDALAGSDDEVPTTPVPVQFVPTATTEPPAAVEPEAPAEPPAADAEQPPAESDPGDAGPGYDPTILGSFQGALLDALTVADGNPRDYERLQGFMSDQFTISGWGAGGATRTSAQAAEELRTTFLPPAAVMTFTIGTDFAALLGSDPKTLFPDAASLILAEGWGSDGTAQAIIIISQDGNGNYVWSGVVIAEYGFSAASGDITLAGFESLLMQAVVARDFGQMRLLMGDPFAISGWQAGGSEWSPVEATERLRTLHYPPAGHNVTFGPQPDLTALLGQDPVTFFPGAASVLYSAGWGATANGEAVLVVKQTADGVFYWSSILIADNGF